MILLLSIIFTLVYLIFILVYEYLNDMCFAKRDFINLRELRKYKDKIIITGGGASVRFGNEEWGIIFTPLNFWYYIYLLLFNTIENKKIQKENKENAPWRL